jgi:mono/diheme cytochrome c family protein
MAATRQELGTSDNVPWAMGGLVDPAIHCRHCVECHAANGANGRSRAGSIWPA